LCLTNHFSTKIVLLLILGFSLSGCGLPIIVSGTKLMTIGTGDRGGSLAIFYSLIIYAIWLGVFISIPLNIKRTFTVPQRYKKYKLFWWVISLVHMISWLLLLHYRLQDMAFYWGVYDTSRRHNTFTNSSSGRLSIS